MLKFKKNKKQLDPEAERAQDLKLLKKTVQWKSKSYLQGCTTQGNKPISAEVSAAKPPERQPSSSTDEKSGTSQPIEPVASTSYEPIPSTSRWGQPSTSTSTPLVAFEADKEKGDPISSDKTQNLIDKGPARSTGAIRKTTSIQQAASGKKVELPKASKNTLQVPQRYFRSSLKGSSSTKSMQPGRKATIEDGKEDYSAEKVKRDAWEAAERDRPSTSRGRTIHDGKEDYIAEKVKRDAWEAAERDRPSTSRGRTIHDGKEDYSAEKVKRDAWEAAERDRPSTSRGRTIHDGKEDYSAEKVKRDAWEAAERDRPSTSRGRTIHGPPRSDYPDITTPEEAKGLMVWSNNREIKKSQLPPLKDKAKLVDQFFKLQNYSRRMLRELRFHEASTHKTSYHNIFIILKTYLKLWHVIETRRDILNSYGGLRLEEVAEIASDIAEIYYNLYLRTHNDIFLFNCYKYYRPYRHLIIYRDNTANENEPRGRTILEEAIIIGNRTINLSESDLPVDMCRITTTVYEELDNYLLYAPITSDRTLTERGSQPNIRLLFRPTLTDVLSYLARGCAELSSSGALFLYMTSEGTFEPTMAPGSVVVGEGGIFINNDHLIGPNRRNHKDDDNCLFPRDITTFTLRPLFVVVDSNNSHIYRNITPRTDQPIVVLMSPMIWPSNIEAENDGSLFTLFLHSPVTAFFYACGISQITLRIWEQCQSMVAEFMEVATIIISESRIDPAYRYFMRNRLLRRIILRYIFCEVFTRSHHAFQVQCHFPWCIPDINEESILESQNLREIMYNLAAHLNVNNLFHNYNHHE